jgi:hypothetical protein
MASPPQFLIENELMASRDGHPDLTLFPHIAGFALAEMPSRGRQDRSHHTRKRPG